MELRDYQLKALAEIAAHWDAGERLVLWAAPTGAGKGVVLSHVLEDAAKRGLRALFVVRGRNLVNQGSERLSCSHGVLMAGHQQYAPDMPIQVCSIDTMRARKLWPAADLVVIDEVHWACSDSYKTLAEQYPRANFLGVTATPYPEKSIRHVSNSVVETCTIRSLIETGHLVPPRYFAPFTPELRGVKKTGGDYNEKDLDRIMGETKLVGKIVDTWRTHGENRPTLAFACSVRHSKMICEAFLEEWISAEHMDASTPDSARHAIISRSRRGITQVVVNCGILTTGVDLPWISCLIVARPTMSPVLNRQMLGRGTRPYEGKTDFKILDHAGNTTRHPFITVDIPPEIDGATKKGRAAPAPTRTCPECYGVCYASFTACPCCGYTFAVKSREITEEDGELREVTHVDVIGQAVIMKNKLLWVAKKRGLKRGWIFHMLAKKFGRSVAAQILPFNTTSEVGGGNFV